MNEQVLKRLQDSMKMLAGCLEQLQEIGWLVHDIIEDLELELHPGQAPVDGPVDGSKTPEVPHPQ